MNQDQDKAVHYCSNCQINIPNDSEYQAHYRSDFHRYNIRRKLLSLEPVNQEVFQKKFLESQSNTSCSSSQCESHYCSSCKKSYYSQGTYTQHLNSQKHKTILKELQTKELPNPLKIVQSLQEKCLFCDHSEEQLDPLLMHMNQIHGFFIWDEKYLVDRAGLMSHLRRIIDKQNCCFKCTAIFSNPDSTRAHMIDKGHCFMPHEQYGGFLQYYDFKEKLQEMTGELQNIIEVDEDSDIDLSQVSIINPDESQNTIDFDLIELTDEQTQRKKHFLQMMHHILQTKATLLPNGELQLPNGKILGHRCFKKYYQQCHETPIIPVQRHLAIENQQVPFLVMDNVSLGMQQNQLNRKYMRKRE